MGSTGSSGKKSTVLDVSNLSNIEAMDKITDLQIAMGQTGFEAGDPTETPDNKLYVNTGKAWVINTYLNSDGKTMDTPGTDWDDIISESWVKDAIKKIDSGMKPMAQDLKVSRFIDGDQLGKMLGMGGTNNNTVDKLIEALENKSEYPTVNKKFKDVLAKADYTQKAYTSTTYSGTHGSYGEYPVKLDITIKKGTPSIVTANYNEHEILVGRNQKYNFGKSYKIETLPSGKKQLVIKVTI